MNGRSLRNVLVYGLGVTNLAVARALVRRGIGVQVVDDRPTADRVAVAADLGLALAGPSDLAATTLEGLVGSSAVGPFDAVVCAPGIPETHPVFAAARHSGVRLLSEFDLAAAWDARPMLSITGTNGKTTVTMLVTDMLRRSGLIAEAVGNTDVPLVAAIEDPDVDVFVVEASSFRLAATERFEPLVATWLNFAEDHLDVHLTLAGYEAAKARSWRDLGPGSTAVANADDPVVRRHVGEGGGVFVTFGLAPEPPSTDGTGHGSPHYTVVDGALITPAGEVIVRTSEMFRAMPHDVSNALAAAATALAGGASLEGVRAALIEFAGLPHRVQLVAERDGVRWFDDSKATAPHAVVAAVEGFDSVVLVAGGRNKGLDLSVLVSLAPRLRGVVGIGESAADVVAAFDGVSGASVSVATASSMALAVRHAHAMARSGDVVLLSPGCASFDWYDNYGQRGDAFAAEVRELLEQH